MPATVLTKSMTLRLPPDIYAAATELARKRTQSLNSFINESLAQKIQDEEDREMFEAAELLGQFPEECSVEYAFAAQSQVVLGVHNGWE